MRHTSDTPKRLLPVIALALGLATTACGAASEAAPASSGGDDPVGALEKNATPLESTELGDDTSDLRPFGKMVGDAKIVGLGEGTHSSREFVTVQQRIFDYLHKEKDFSTFAREVSWGTGLQINEYVLHGKGDPKQIMRKEFQEMYGTYNNQEFLDLITWMREYNTTHDDKIQFMGNDHAYPSDVVFDEVMDYVAKHSPDQSAKFEKLYRELRPEPGMGTAAYFEKHRMKMDPETRKRLAKQANEALELIKKQDPGKDEKAHAWAVQNARALSQTATAYSFNDENKATKYRDKIMADNTEWWNKHSGTKMVLSTMASHASYEGYDPLSPDPVGNHLRERMGDSFVNTGFTFNEGSFNSKDANGGPNAGYKTFTVKPAKKGYNERTLDKVSHEDYMLDMRSAPKEARDWLAKERSHRVIGGTYPMKEDMKLSVGKSYDLLIHMNDIEATKMLPSGE